VVRFTDLHCNRLTTWERAPAAHWVGDEIGPRTGLVAISRRTILCLCLDLNLDPLTRNLITVPTD